MTFSLVGRCGRTGRLGVAVTSSSPAVAARCAWARARTGAVATQNVTDPALGSRVLGALAAGEPAASALAEVLATAPHAEFRQLAVIDAAGRTASHSGARTLGRYGARSGHDCLAAGNLLAGDGVPAAMVHAFEQHPADDLAGRLLAALRAGVGAGGEEGPVRSCGLLVVDQVAWPVTDLRVDWHDDPVGELARLLAIWLPQEADYVKRAVDPTAAPKYGVPGEA
ncbi:MAG TPA: DUF1028 domain-containing protein [Streptosporangiaceae bacterium]|nr:DUF1028 domain-containing protein [Streptosporangiaceae bacterium]